MAEGGKERMAMKVWRRVSRCGIEVEKKERVKEGDAGWVARGRRAGGGKERGLLAWVRWCPYGLELCSVW
jgi:hypothetical protein